MLAERDPGVECGAMVRRAHGSGERKCTDKSEGSTWVYFHLCRVKLNRVENKHRGCPLHPGQFGCLNDGQAERFPVGESIYQLPDALGSVLDHSLPNAVIVDFEYEVRLKIATQIHVIIKLGVSLKVTDPD
jgi:hypothetical protein